MKKRNRFVRFGLVFTVLMSLLLSSCSSDDISKQTFPLSADIFHSIDGKQVAFQGLTHSAISWSWDFGDGTTSAEQNPIHVYTDGGYYVAVLTATDKNGNTEVTEIKMAIAVTPYILLTGGPTATEGKTWKLSASHSSNGDYFALSDPDFSIVDPDITPLPDGAFSLFLGMGEVYDDEFTFHFNGDYEVDLKADGGALSGIVYQFVAFGGANITNMHPEYSEEFGLVVGKPGGLQPDLKFDYVEEGDFVTSSVWTGGAITYSDVSSLSFSDTGFFGFLDFETKVIVREVSDSQLKVVVFMAASQDYIGINTHALVLTFEVVE